MSSSKRIDTSTLKSLSRILKISLIMALLLSLSSCAIAPAKVKEIDSSLADIQRGDNALHALMATALEADDPRSVFHTTGLG